MKNRQNWFLLTLVVALCVLGCSSLRLSETNAHESEGVWHIRSVEMDTSNLGDFEKSTSRFLAGMFTDGHITTCKEGVAEIVLSSNVFMAGRELPHSTCGFVLPDRPKKGMFTLFFEHSLASMTEPFRLQCEFHGGDHVVATTAPLTMFLERVGSRPSVLSGDLQGMLGKLKEGEIRIDETLEVDRAYDRLAQTNREAAYAFFQHIIAERSKAHHNVDKRE